MSPRYSPGVTTEPQTVPNLDAGLQRGPVVVLLAGVVTSALALLGVWWLNTHTDDFHVMGWYGDYVIPAGAILVGLAAGSGYGVASYLTGLRIRRGLLWSVLALQLTAYAAAQYLEFRSLVRDRPFVDEAGEPIGFVAYYHLRAINFAWDDHGHPGKPLGLAGYFFVGLGVVGFALGGVLAPAVLLKKPYCDRCQLYMKSRTLALISASVPARRVGKKDVAGQAAYAEENQRAGTTAQAVLDRVAGLAAKGDVGAMQAELAPYPPRGPEGRRANKVPTRLRLGLVHCRACGAGQLEQAAITGQGQHMRVRLLARTELAPDTTHLLAP
jgi:hypothetical protein